MGETSSSSDSKRKFLGVGIVDIDESGEKAFSDGRQVLLEWVSIEEQVSMYNDDSGLSTFVADCWFSCDSAFLLLVLSRLNCEF